MTKTLKRIEPLQCGKITAALYALMALIIVPFFLLFAVIGALVPQQPGMPSAAAFGIIGALIMVVLVPIFYGVLGFIIGIVGSWVYNLVANWVGGLRFEVE